LTLYSISPSVYLAYPSLYAVQSGYGGGAPGSTIGKTYSDVTVAYPPDYLLTAGCINVTYHGVTMLGFPHYAAGGFHTINFQDFNTPIPWSIVTKAQDCYGNIGGPSHNPSELDYTYTLNPVISIPSALLSFDPAWTACAVDLAGAYDPPRSLSSVAALDPMITADPSPKADPKPTTAPVAQPEPQVSSAPVPSSTADPPSISSNAQQAADPSRPVADSSTPPSGPPAGNSPQRTGNGQSVGNGQGTGNGGTGLSSSAVHDPASPADPPQNNGNSPVGHGSSQQAPQTEATPPQSSGAGGGNNNPKAPSGANAATSAVDPGAAPPPSTGGQYVQTDPNGGIVVGGSTLPPNAQVTVSGIVISQGLSNVMIGSNTFSPLTTAKPAAALPSVGGQQVQAAPHGGIVIGGSTLSPNAQTIISGTPVSVGSSNFVIGSSTYALPTSPSAVPIPPPTIAGQQIQTGFNGAIIVGGSTTLSANGPAATISGTVISVLPSGAGVLVGSSTITLPTGTTPQSVFTLAGQTFTANPTGFAIGSATSLAPGGSAFTISGTVVSLGPSGLQIGSETVPLTGATATQGGSGGGLGSVILSLFGGTVMAASPSTTSTAGSNSTAPVAFTGAMARVEVERWHLGVATVICIGTGALAFAL